MAKADDDKLLEEIRTNFTNCEDFYREIRTEADIDMRFMALDQWDPAEKQARLEAGRPCTVEDQLNQYANQVINEFLINKRDVEVNPTGNGANDKTARLAGDIMRQISYESKGIDARVCAVENAVQRSFGVWGLLTDYVGPDSFEQKIIIRRIPNPMSVYWDPDCKQADFSDMKFAYVLDQVRRTDFKKRFPGATVHDFTSEHMKLAPRWIKDDAVQTAEYWKVEERRRELLMIQEPTTGQPTKVFLDEIGEDAKVEKDRIVLLPSEINPQGGIIPILKDDTGQVLRRKTVQPEVCQYITNGIEILETNPWLGSYIPLFPVVGKEMYVDFGAGPRRVWFSLIRGARAPQMRLNFARTNELESIGMVPKTKWVMYEGQIEGHEEEWQNANRSPIVALQVKPILDATGNAVLPLPQRQDYNPPIASTQMSADSASRAIQSALGMYNASVGQHDTNAKSGIAIQRLDSRSEVGTFHFRASYDRALVHEGRCMEELLTKHYTTPREVGTRSTDGKYKVIRINQPYFDPETNEQVEYPITTVRHTMTIGAGPWYESDRQRIQDRVDLIVKQAPELLGKIGDLLFKLMNLGPVGDAIAERLTPPEFKTGNGQQIPPEVQKQLADASQMIEMLTQQVNQLTEERQYRLLELQSREKIEQLRIDLDKYKADLQAVTKQEQMSSNENLALMEQRLTLALESDRIKLEQRIDQMGQMPQGSSPAPAAPDPAMPAMAAMP